jgi:hypothetical protein
MYQYPFLLLTEDDVRNSTIADMIEEDMLETSLLKKNLYNRLPDSIDVKKLYDLLEIQVIMTKMLCDFFRSHMNVLHRDLPEIDIWRIKEKLKRTLTVTRRNCADLLHNYDGYVFGDTLRKLDLWEDHPVLRDAKPQKWNNHFLNRISDIHRHMYRLCLVLEDILLLQNQQLKSVDNKGRDNQDHIANINSLGKITEACRTIHKEVKDYIRLVDSF